MLALPRLISLSSTPGMDMLGGDLLLSKRALSMYDVAGLYHQACDTCQETMEPDKLWPLEFTLESHCGLAIYG
jgi:hypothetical protein